MSEERLRRRVAQEAARLIYEQETKGHRQAKRKAARRFHGEAYRRRDLPTDREIREHLGEVARQVERLRLDEPTFLESADRESSSPSRSPVIHDRFRVYELLLEPLEQVREDPETHPEGDALYHSLQVFELARSAIPYDEEFLLAALLHDVGKAIDWHDPIVAGLEALEGFITNRTVWLIEHQEAAQSLRAGTIGTRFRRRLEASPNFDELMLLAECDLRGRRQGVTVPDVQEAIAYLRHLAEECGE